MAGCSRARDRQRQRWLAIAKDSPNFALTVARSGRTGLASQRTQAIEMLNQTVPSAALASGGRDPGR
jgi:hypothetical protein